MYTYRVLGPNDLAWLDQAAFAAAWESLPASDQADTLPQTVAMRSRQQWEEALGSSLGIGLVACAGTQPVGFVLASLGADGTTGEWNGHILMLWVNPYHRRRGVGRQLQTLADQFFLQRGIRKAKLWTPLKNQAAIRLAWQQGYRPEGLIGVKQL